MTGHQVASGARVRSTKPAETFGVYMLVKDRRKLRKLMVIQGISTRKLAAAAGWSSHTYLVRLLSGEKTSLDNDPAVRIATYLGVDLYDIFLPRPSSTCGHIASSKRTRRAA